MSEAPVSFDTQQDRDEVAELLGNADVFLREVSSSAPPENTCGRAEFALHVFRQLESVPVKMLLPLLVASVSHNVFA